MPDAPSRPAVVFGGRGAVGALFVDLLLRRGATVAADLGAAGPSSDPRADHVVADATDPLAASDVLGRAGTVVLALPETVIGAAAESVAARMSSGSLLVHTASVQTVGRPVSDAARRHGLAACGVDPMFAPGLGFRDRPVVVTTSTVDPPAPAVVAFVDLLTAAGSRVEQMTPEEHDEITADLQVAVHAAVLAFGQHLCGQAHPAARHLALATPPFRTLALLLARIASGEPEVYRAIQHSHPGARRTRESLHRALDTVATATDDPAEFAALLGSIRDWLGADRPELAARCAALFDGFVPQGVAPPA